MSPRRVIRAPDITEKEVLTTTKKVKTLPILFIVLKRVLCIIWKTLTIIWYWFERAFLLVFLLVLTIGLAWWLSQKPSLYRDWEDMDAVLPTISWSGNIVNIENIRNHTWKTDTEFTPGYYTDSFNLDEIEKVYYSITPFSDRDGPAHTMVSFSFSGGKNVVISAELRKERGESFDAIKEILNLFEIQYVIASESDVVKLRTNYRKNEVYMYPINTPKEKVQALFRSMIIRADKLNREPEFYNTLWNNCTTSVLMHANALRKEKLEWGTYTILPAHSDAVLHQAGLIDTKLPLPEARQYYRIDEIAQTLTGSTSFSDAIRKPIQ